MRRWMWGFNLYKLGKIVTVSSSVGNYHSIKYMTLHENPKIKYNHFFKGQLLERKVKIYV